MSPVRLRTVELARLFPNERDALVRRSPVPDEATNRDAAAIVEAVRHGGDAALVDANRAYGGGRTLGRLRVHPSELHAALEALDPRLVDALTDAAAHLRACHRPQRPEDETIRVVPGVTVERRWSPLRRVGVYVPGGRAAYPSSLLMAVIPARVAGVAQIAVVSPADDDGEIAPVLAAAAALMGIDEFYATGGAQAVAALAHGTETIPAVDKIVGPGNAWVTAAKLAVYGDAAIDLPAGPSEAVALADGTADARFVAADLLCQAEHGAESPAVLVTTDREFADAVLAELDTLLPTLDREPVLRAALADHGLVVIAPHLEDAIAFVNDYAPEHVGVDTDDAEKVAAAITNAGSVFVGPWSPHSAGDYATGGNHILPTGGLARTHGPLSVADFGSWRQVQTLDREGLSALRSTISLIAAAEGLTAHRLAVDVRFGEGR